jgi:DnaK suppressor protein
MPTTARKSPAPTSPRERLLAQRTRIQGQEARIGRHLREGIPADSEDQAQAILNDEVMNALDAKGRTELASIDAALLRLEHGAYGVCTRCGEAIDARRLEALPTTVSCRACALR